MEVTRNFFVNDLHMTTGYDVLNDLIKIGVPSIATGATAFLIARAARSHDFEKERRRRKQDFLEAVADTFADFQQKLQSSFSHTLAVFNPRPGVEEAARHAIERDSRQADREMQDAQTKLVGFQTKLRLLGFADCADMLAKLSVDISLIRNRLLASQVAGKLDDHISTQVQFLNAKGEEFAALVSRRYSEL